MAVANPNALLLVDYRMPDEGWNRLRALRIPLCASEALLHLPEGIKGHPDLQAASLFGTLYCHNSMGRRLKKDLDDLKAPYQICPTRVTPPYPGHVGFNALISPTLFVHKLSATDPVLLEAAKGYAKKGVLRLLDVGQGYSRCAAAYVGKDSYITEDVSIARGLRLAGKKVLQLPYGSVSLQGFRYGFIGGALTAVTVKGDSLVLISGDPKCSPHWENLQAFFLEVGVIPYPLLSGPLQDVGSILHHSW